jgi:hypothetical protein
VKLRVELTPSRFVPPFKVSSINTSVVPRCVVPRDPERAIAASKRSQKCKLQNIADVAGILIAHRPPPIPVWFYPSTYGGIDVDAFIRPFVSSYRSVGVARGFLEQDGRQDKSVAVVGFFCSSDQRLIAFSPEGPAGVLWEFANDINAVCAIHRCSRAVWSLRKLDGKGKGRMAAGRMSLKRLRLLDSRRTPPAGASGQKINDINTPSAIGLSGDREALSLASVASV